METPKKIHLINSTDVGRFEEDRSSEIITPGMLLATNSTGTVRKHNVAGGYHERKFAIEDRLQGLGIGDDYPSGGLVLSVHANPGDVVYGWLANGEHATADKALTSNGDGTLKVSVSNTDKIVGKALEEVNLTDTAVANGRIRVRVI
jgi:hypothetical protein